MLNELKLLDTYAEECDRAAEDYESWIHRRMRSHPHDHASIAEWAWYARETRNKADAYRAEAARPKRRLTEAEIFVRCAFYHPLR